MSLPLTIGGVSAKSLVESFGSPLFVYDESVIADELDEWQAALSIHPKTRICYAVKANSNLKLLDYFAKRGLSFDIVSGGELARLQKIGVSGANIVFSGVGKSRQEIEQALDAQVHVFNIESLSEMDLLSTIGQAHGIKIPVAVRINPDIDAKTHPYISTGLTENKFGVALPTLREAYARLANDAWLSWEGLDCHIGSNLQDPAPYHEAADTLFLLNAELRDLGINLRHLDFGGGMGVRYKPDDMPPTVSDFVSPILQKGLEEISNNHDLELIFEPGRRLIAQAGFLLTQVEMVKTTAHRRFLVVDASMTEILRPALYQAYHDIVPAWQTNSNIKEERCDVVGPVCESADFLGKDRLLAAQAGDGLAVKTAGAYCSVMSSNYNTRPRAAEVWIEKKSATCIRRREKFDDLIRMEVFD